MELEVTKQDDIQIIRCGTPIESRLIDELLGFWETTFECSFASLRAVLAGEETQNNRDTLLVAFAGERIAGTCRLTISKADPRLGLVGDVATDPDFRGMGIARDICSRAVREFEGNGGDALFLATSNPSAEYLYSSLGWHKLAGSNVMMNPVCGAICEEYLVDYFKSGCDLPVHILQGNLRQCVTMVPLLITPHDSDLLDINANMRSVRYAKQLSCEGLYGRYAGIDGAWFAVERADGVAVGLSSASIIDGEGCIDAFTHSRYGSCLNDLYKVSINWVKANGASAIYIVCPKSDIYKKRLLANIECLADVEIRTETPDWFSV
jgi:GNAT superfamily N-acetyltransferase